MKKAAVILLVSFIIGYSTPYLMAVIITDGDPNCTGCTTNNFPTSVTCNGGPCNGGTTSMDETSCNKCCTDATTSVCSHKDGTLNRDPVRIDPTDGSLSQGQVPIDPRP